MHRAFGQKAGLTDAQLDGMDSYGESDAYSPLEKLVLRYAEELTERAEADESVVQALKGHLSEQELVELTLMISLANMTNRFSEALKPEFL